MAKSKIEWTEYTINPISGCNGAVCADGIWRQCPYCYAKTTAENERMSRAFPDKFELTYHPERLKQFAALKRPSLIFVDSMGDLFGDGVRPEWVKEIFAAMAKSDQHIYQILTKNPERIPELVTEDMYRPNIWLGVSVDTVWGCHRIAKLQNVPEFKKFISFEPLLEQMPKEIDLHDIEWVIIGQRTKPFNYPPEDWVADLVYQCLWSIPLIPYFVKNNLLDRGYLKRTNKSDFQKYPTEMQKIKQME
jgi:protein gp37